MTQLTQLTRLEKLKLFINIQNEELPHLPGNFSNLNRLTKLNIYSIEKYSLVNPHEQDYKQLTQMSSLKYLKIEIDFPFGGVPPEVLTILPLKAAKIHCTQKNVHYITRLTNLIKLNLGYAQEDQSAFLPENLSDLSALTKLELSQIRNEEDIKRIAQLTSLIYLKLEFDPEFMINLPKTCLSALGKIDYINLELGYCENLSDFFQTISHNIKKLTLSDCKLDDGQMSQISRLTNLRDLRLMEDQELVYKEKDLCNMLAFLHNMTNIEILVISLLVNLKGCLPVDKQQERCDELRRFTALSHINITCKLYPEITQIDPLFFSSR
jgi:Leucine-rich repeat (LRR) protein